MYNKNKRYLINIHVKELVNFCSFAGRFIIIVVIDFFCRFLALCRGIESILMLEVESKLRGWIH